MTSDTPLFGTCEICIFGSLLVTLFGSLMLFVGFRIDMNNNDMNNNGVFNVGLVILICCLVGIYIVLTTWLYGYIANKIINFIFGEPDKPDSSCHCSFIPAIVILPLLLTGSMWLALDDVFDEMVDTNNPFYKFLKILIPHFIGCIILILMYGVIICGLYIKSLRYRRCNNDSYNIDV